MESKVKVSAEEWVAVKGYEGSYEVSNLGEVRGLDRIVARSGNCGNQTVKGRTIKTSKGNHGYLQISLRLDGKRYNHLVHRIVADAFVLNPYKLEYVLFIDGDKGNVKSSNLSWSDMSEINTHVITTGRKDYSKRKPRSRNTH